MPFSQLSRVYLRNCLLVALGLSALWLCRPAPEVAKVELSPEESLAKAALDNVLGAGNYELYLTIERHLYFKTVESKEIGNSAVLNEQIKLEELGANACDDGRRYHQQVTSRNYLVEERDTREVSTENRLAGIRCVVLVSPAVAKQTETARAVLEELLGFNTERGDRLTFLPRP